MDSFRTVVSEIIIAFFAVYGFYCITDEIKNFLHIIAHKNIDKRSKKSDNITIVNNQKRHDDESDYNNRQY